MSRKKFFLLVYFVLLPTALTAQSFSSFRQLEQTVDSLYYSADYQNGYDLLHNLLYANTTLNKKADTISAFLHYKLGVFSLELAKYGDAEEELILARSQYTNIYSSHHELVASVWSRLAVLYSEQSRYGDAVEAAKEQLKDYTTDFGVNDRFTVLAAIGLAEYYLLANNISSAEALITKYSDSYHSSYPENTNEHLRFLKLQGDIAFAKKQFDRADQIYSTAISRSTTVQNLRLILRGKIELERARARTIMTEDDSALTDIENAINDIKHSQNTSLLLIAKCHLVAAVIHEQQGSTKMAFESYRNALEIYRQATKENFRYTSERERLEFIRDVTLNSGRVFSTVIRNVALHPEGNSLAYDWLLWIKGIVLTSVQSTRSTAINSGDTVITALLDSIAMIRSRRSVLGISNNLLIRKPYFSADSLDNVTGDLEKRVARLSAKYCRFASNGSIHWNDVKSHLPSDACAIEITNFQYYDGERISDSMLYAAFSISGQDQFAPKATLIGNSSDINDPAVMREYFRAISAQNVKPAARNKALLRVSNVLWSPLERLTKSFKTIYLSPDGVYSQISFASLDLDLKTQLIDKYRIVLLANTADLIRDSSSTHSNSIAILADPNYDNSTSSEMTSAVSPTSVSALVLERLPATKVEAMSISGLFKKVNWQTTTYLGAEATEAQLEKIHRPGILHIATHGRFSKNIEDSSNSLSRSSSTTNSMLGSSLFLGGANTTLREGSSNPSNDGVLTALEAMSLDLENTELVALSSCESGKGVIEPGEGVIGLPRAFRTAGARNILMSLWKVPDKETSELMSLFYKRLLEGASNVDALRDAQLSMRTTVKKRYNSDISLYWAGFVLIGY